MPCLIQIQPDDQQDYYNNLSLGFHLNNFQQDFSLGVSVTSPYFVNNSIAVEASYNVAWRDGILKTESISNWYTYSSLQVGLIGVGGMVGKSVRTYGSGGLIVLFPDSEFSSQSTELGGYGVWEFEFLITTRVSYYIELGGTGVGARADKMVSEPIYSNGFSTTVGLHVFL